MSGETKHKTHAALWTRIDDRTIERRINHDNGLEYATERLSASADAQTLTETHFGKRPDGTAYETVWAFAKRDGTNDAESPVAAQSNLETAQRPSSLQLPPEMQSLERALEGRWSTTEKYEPDEWTPNGGTGYGEEVWQRGPGGFTFREEVHDHTPSGEEFGVGFSWWDRTKGLQGMWCVNTNPQGCDIQGAASGLGPKWYGKRLVIEAEFPRDGKTFSWHEVFSDITPTSFTQTADIGEKGGPLKRWLTIHGTKIAEGQSAAVAQKLIMPGPDVQNLMLGTSSTKIDYPPSLSIQSRR